MDVGTKCDHPLVSPTITVSPVLSLDVLTSILLALLRRYVLLPKLPVVAGLWGAKDMRRQPVIQKCSSHDSLGWNA
jgi:hypothetical protein